MNKYLKNILLITLSFVLLLGILIFSVLWTYSNNIPDYKFHKRNFSTNVLSNLNLWRESYSTNFKGQKTEAQNKITGRPHYSLVNFYIFEKMCLFFQVN